MNNYQELLEELRSVDYITYKMLEVYLNSRSFGKMEMKLRDSISRRLYSLFCKCISRDDVRSLKFLDKRISELIEKITDGTDWTISSSGAILMDNFINQDDPEFASHDTYELHRDEIGFHVGTDLERRNFNGYYKKIYDTEEAFLYNHREEFEELHRLMYEKENIMRGQYSIRENANDSLPRLIAEYMGYFREERTRHL